MGNWIGGLGRKVGRAIASRMAARRRSPHSEVRAYRCFGLEAANVPDAAPDAGRPAPMPEDLVIPMGVYGVEDRTFRIEAPGVYRVYALGRFSLQRVVPGEDLDAWLKTVGWLWSHGNADDHQGVRGLRRLIRQRRLVISCTHAAMLCGELLTAAGYEARMVLAMTLETWNRWDNGHTLLEVRVPDGAWFAYDPSFACVFAQGDRRLSLPEFVAAVRADEPYDIHVLTGGDRAGVFRRRGYDFGFWVEHRAAVQEEMRRWHRRIAWVPTVYDDGRWLYTGGPETARRLATYDVSLTYLEPERFAERFYTAEPRYMRWMDLLPPGGRAPVSDPEKETPRWP
jgi:hypothetical protein